MSIVEFKFDREKDLKNIWETANAKVHYGFDFRKCLTKNILKICEGRKYKGCRKELLGTMSSLYKNDLVGDVVKSVSLSWVGVEKEYFKRLEKLTETLKKRTEEFETAQITEPNIEHVAWVYEKAQVEIKNAMYNVDLRPEAMLIKYAKAERVDAERATKNK